MCCCKCVTPVQITNITVENPEFSNATIVIELPDTVTPVVGCVYDLIVNVAVPVTVSGASVTIGGEYLYGKAGCYKRIGRLYSPFILRVRYLSDPNHYNFISMRALPWTMCA